MKTNHRKKEIFSLFKDENLETETRELKEIRKVATYFYEKLWSNRNVTRAHSLRKINRLIRKIRRRISKA